MKVERVENMCGGKGHVIIKHILGEKELNGKCGLYAKVVIEPGCTLGYRIMNITEKARPTISFQGKANMMIMGQSVQ